MISVNESRAAYINIRIFFCYFYIFYAKRQRKYSNRRIKQVLLCSLNESIRHDITSINITWVSIKFTPTEILKK